MGRAVPRISVGTAVVPIYPRHPQILASAAKTAQAATGGRFQLGIGLGAKDLLEPAYGLPYPPPITHLREYLGALRPLLDGADTGYRDATVTSHPFGATAVAGAEQAIPAWNSYSYGQGQKYGAVAPMTCLDLEVWPSQSGRRVSNWSYLATSGAGRVSAGSTGSPVVRCRDR